MPASEDDVEAERDAEPGAGAKKDPTNAADVPAKGASDDVAALFPGSMLLKPARVPAPGLVVLHGSEGGKDAAYRTFAQSMAKEGFVVIALCWSGCAPAPAASPLDEVAKAGAFLKGSSDTTGKVGVFGWDTGAEAALVLAGNMSANPFDAVATFNATDVVRSKWTLDGEPIAPGEAIAVERYRGSLLVMHGDTDERWPLAGAASILEKRSTMTDTTAIVVFTGAGHTLTSAEDKARLREDATGWFEAHLAP